MTATTTVSSGLKTRPVRPVGATVVVALSVVAAAVSFWDGITILIDADGDRWETARGALQVGLGVLALAVGIGALGTRSWAWKLFMTWAVFGLTFQILRHFFFGGANYFAMAIDVVAVFALTPRDVQVAFEIQESPSARLDLQTRNPLDRD